MVILQLINHREWFRRFKDRDFSVEDKPCSGQPKKFEDKELEALLEEDQNQTQEKLAESLEVTQQAVSVQLRAMEMIQKQGNWVPYELKPRDVERRFFTCLRTADSKTTEKRFSASDCDWRWEVDILWQLQEEKILRWARSTSIPRPNVHDSKIMLCIWWDQKGLYYKLLKSGDPFSIGYN